MNSEVHAVTNTSGSVDAHHAVMSALSHRVAAPTFDMRVQRLSRGRSRRRKPEEAQAEDLSYEDLCNRIGKRLHLIQIIKTSREYEILERMDADKLPCYPDMGLSKRKWEKAMAEVRSQLLKDAELCILVEPLDNCLATLERSAQHNNELK